MKLTQVDYKNLQTLLSRVTYQGLEEAKLAVVLDAKLTAAQQESDDSTSANQSSPDQPTGD